MIFQEINFYTRRHSIPIILSLGEAKDAKKRRLFVDGTVRGAYYMAIDLMCGVLHTPTTTFESIYPGQTLRPIKQYST